MISPYKIVKDLGFERLAGSSGESRAREVITGYIKQLGLKYILEEFELNSFNPGSAEINCQDLIYPARPYGLNETMELKGELVYLNDPDILTRNRGFCRAKIIISSAFSRQLAPVLKEAGVKGFIRIGNPGRAVSSLSHRQNSFKEGYVPSVTVKHEVGEKLIRLQGQEISLKIIQDVKKTKAGNLVVDIPGKGRDETLTIVTAHYDSVAQCVGASDNAGGTAVLIKMAEYFSRHQPQRDLRLIFFSGEELGLLGSQNYVEVHADELKTRAGLVLNVDVAGDPVGLDVANIIGTDLLRGYFAGISQEAGIFYKTKLEIYSSDCMPFTKYEIPSVNLARVAGKASFHIHTENDAVRFVKKPGLDNPVKASLNLLKRILNAEIYPVEREIDPSLKDKIMKYLWNLNYVEPELEWKKEYKR
jgi:Zn-dependent M28 family amino/carboxypeptidase